MDHGPEDFFVLLEVSSKVVSDVFVSDQRAVAKEIITVTLVQVSPLSPV